MAKKIEPRSNPQPELPLVFASIQFTFATFGSLIFCMLLGKILDDTFHTSPILLAVGVIVGIIVSFFEMHKMLKAVMKK